MSDFPWQLACPYMRARVRLSLCLRDFETVIPSPERPLGLPHLPLNPDVMSIFADQSPFVLNPWQVPIPRECSWDPSDPSHTRAYIGPLPMTLERLGVILPVVVFPPCPTSSTQHSRTG
jgi:hypothetical protein